MAKDMAAAAEVAAETQVFRRKEVEGELNFVSDLDALDAMLEADNIVARFKNPINPEGDPIDFEMRPMTPGEYAIYYQTLFGHTLTETTPAPDTLTAEELQDAEQLQDELDVKKYDTKLLNILESCIQQPLGVTAQRMRKWDPFYVMRLHNALIGGSRPSKPVAQFSKLDKSS